MEIEDSRNALFCEPNAYIQHYNSTDCPKTPPKKVVFSEPYDCLPNYHMNNGFKKGNCDCLPKCKPKPCNPFDFKQLLPIITSLCGGGKNNFADLIKCFSSGDMSSVISSIISKPDMLDGLTNMFKKPSKQQISTDFEIKNYTKVD